MNYSLQVIDVTLPWTMGAISIQGSVNNGFQTVVWVLSGEQIPAPHLNLSFTSVLPQLYLLLTSSFTSF